jgi:hypothetical protein
MGQFLKPAPPMGNPVKKLPSTLTTKATPLGRDKHVPMEKAGGQIAFSVNTVGWATFKIFNLKGVGSGYFKRVGLNGAVGGATGGF